MKKFLLLALIGSTAMAQAATRNSVEKDLDYCATAKSWVAQRVIQAEYLKNNRLQREKATSVLINRTALVKENGPIILPGWGPLYTQTTAVTIPWSSNQQKPVSYIVTAIVSAAECSLTEPAYIALNVGEAAAD